MRLVWLQINTQSQSNDEVENKMFKEYFNNFLDFMVFALTLTLYICTGGLLSFIIVNGMASDADLLWTIIWWGIFLLFNGFMVMVIIGWVMQMRAENKVKGI